MALARVKTWAAEILTYATLNAEFDNILNNALSLISPLTGNLNAGLNQITNLLLEKQSSTQSAATEGRIYYQTTTDQVNVDDGTNMRVVPTIASVARGDTIYASAASTWARLAIGTSGKAIISDGTDPAWTEIPLPRAYLAGLAISNNGSDATNDIDIAVGAARDKDNSANIVLASALTKQLDAAWAVGTNAGMLATGAAITNTTYHIFLILRPDTGVVDVAADTSVTGANIAANTNAAYTKIRRIGSIVRSGATILAFSQHGDEFLWNAAVLDVNAVPNANTAQTATLTLPTGVKFEALFRGQVTDATTSGIAVLFSSPDESDQAASETAAPGASITSVGAGPAISGHFRIRTNTSAQIRYRCETADIDLDIQISTYGWVDRRGRND
jgi:hypothetical protein